MLSKNNITGELNESLLDKQEVNPNLRTIYFDGRTQPSKLPDNSVKNTKYKE